MLGSRSFFLFYFWKGRLKLPTKEYLEAVLETMKKLLSKDQFDKIHAIALPVSGGNAKANRVRMDDIEKVNLTDMIPKKLKKMPKDEIGLAWLRLNQWFNNAKQNNKTVEDFVNAGKFVLDEMMNREMDYDNTLDLSRAIGRLGKMVGLNKDDFRNLPEEVMVVPDFISIVGSSVRSDSPNDIDVLYRADNTDRGDFIVRWENGHLALRNTLSTIRPDLTMHEIYNPQGSREQQWLPAYHLVLRKSKDELRMVKQEAPSLPNWQDYLPLDKESDDIWLDLGCGQGKADGFIGIDQELYPNVDIRTDISKGIPFNDSSVSVIRANHFIEHLPDFEKIIGEIARVLMDGGTCIMTMPSTDGAGAYAHPDHKIFINKTEFENKIAECDYFDVIKIQERMRDREGIECVDIDAVLKRKHRIRKEEVKKITPFKIFEPTKPTMSGTTEAFEPKELAEWAKDRYPIGIESKHNGFRALISGKNGKIELWYEGQLGKNQLQKFPEIESELKQIQEDFILDCDIAIERNGKRLSRPRLMILNADKPKLEQGDRVVITAFDILFRGEDLTDIPWEERRGILKDFYQDNFVKRLKNIRNFKLSPMKTVRDEQELSPAIRWAFGFDMSEGLVAKAMDSIYEQGGTREWFKLKRVAEIKIIVLAKQKTKTGIWNYTGGLIPSEGMELTNLTEFEGKKYVDLGKSFSSSIDAQLGDILTTTVLELISNLEKKTLAWLGARVIDIDDTRKKPYTAAQALDIAERSKVVQKQLSYMVPSVGPSNAKIAFIGASPGKTESARGEPLVGPSGETFNENYLKPLEIKREDVFITNAVPILLLDENSNVREPNDEELTKWSDWLEDEVERANPAIIVALGQSAKRALGDLADFVLPHPMAIRRFGDSGEVPRKLRQIKRQLPELGKGLPTESDVHIPSTEWDKRRIRKQDEEGDVTRAEVSTTFWNKNWQNMYPETGKGTFSYQRHWRGLSEEESKLSEAKLLETDHSLHGDLRLTAGDGDSLWGFSVFLGRTKDNRAGDRLINLPQDDNLQGQFKLEQPKAWLDIARDKPYIVEPGGPGSTAKTFAKFFEEDHGGYKIGVWKQHLVEVFFYGSKLKGRYLLEFAPIGGKRIWIIDRPNGKD